MCHDDIGGKCGGNATPVASEGTPDVTPVASRSQSPDLSQEVFDPSAEKYKRAITEENLQWIDSTKLKRLPPEYFEKVKVFLGAICGDAASYTEQEDRDLAMQYLGKFGICCKPGAEIVILNGKNFGRMIGSLATYTGNRTTTEPEVMSRVARRGERKDKRAVNNDSKEEPPTFNWGLNGLQRSGSDWSE
jgi:hypothetical protein